MLLVEKTHFRTG